jgi:hypothetical protein
MGLSFSVPEGIKIPSSLQNMFKELHKDLGCTVPSHGNLERWAVQVRWPDRTLEYITYTNKALYLFSYVILILTI